MNDNMNDFKDRGGQKSRPSNGTEGEIFMAHFCDQCTHDDGDVTKACNIIARTMVFDIDDPEYPTEWQYGPGGHPVCTKFTKA